MCLLGFHLEALKFHAAYPPDDSRYGQLKGYATANSKVLVRPFETFGRAEWIQDNHNSFIHMNLQ
jgi:hypothetical protein